MGVISECIDLGDAWRLEDTCPWWSSFEAAGLGNLREARADMPRDFALRARGLSLGIGGLRL